MAIGVRNDPVLAYNFLIAFVDTSSVLGTIAAGIQSAAAGGFSECGGLESSLQVEEYREGGRNGGVLKFPTRVTWGNLTLKRGLTADSGLWGWYHGFVQGRGRRRDGLIVLQTD